MKKANNKLTKIIIIAVSAALVATASAVTINAFSNNSSAVKEISETEPVTQEDIEETENIESSEISENTEPDNSDNEEDIEDDEFGLAEKDRRLEEEDRYYEENDAKALEIFKKYGVADALMQTRDDEFRIMFKACDMLRNNELTEEETPIIETYLEGRYRYLNPYDKNLKDTDGKLSDEIMELLGYERLANVCYGF